MNYGSGVTQITNDADLWPKIEADFKFAYDNLPEIQEANGRANKWVAVSYLAKTYLYESKFAEAKTLFDLIVANGKTASGQKYALVPDFTTLFNAANSINSEAIFAIQNAANTGSVNNADPDMVLNFPFSGGCVIP